MAPLKFEDHIKDKLEERSIAPSDNAWDKLEAQLDTQSKVSKKTYNRVVVLMAASVIVFLMLIPFLEFSKKVSPVVETVKIIVPKNDFIPEVIDESRLVENYDQVEIETNTEPNNSSKKKIKKYKKITPSKIKNKPIYTQSKITLIEKQETEVPSDVVLSFQNKQSVFIEDSLTNQTIGIKIADLLVQVEQIEKENGQVTDEEINSLLRRAQQEIITDQLMQEGKTNALSLLEDVEIELDETFKQRVFEALKTSFSKLRTVVAERDN